MALDSGSISTDDFILRLPDEAHSAADQDEEWFEVEHRGRTRRLRFHDYADIYSIPGLYERLIYDELRCESPRVIAGLVADLLADRAAVRERLDAHRLNALTCVAALGFGDIPPDVFLEGLSHLATPALVAFTIKERFLGDGDPSGFASLIDRLYADGTLREIDRVRYQHRLSWAGEPLHYVAVLAEKTGVV